MPTVPPFALAGSLLCLVACCGSSTQETQKPAGTAVAPPTELGDPVAPARAAYYAKAFSGASFRQKRIPSEMIRSADQGNELFVEARDAQGKLVGFLRDFTGPVSTSDTCACSPLTLTLVFEADYRLRTLLTPAPLQKLGHVEMTPAEQTKLIDIVRAPAPELMQVKRVDDVVDAVSGATKPELKPYVVAEAGLSTRRIAGLVAETRDILQGVKLGSDKQRLDAIMNQAKSEAAAVQALAGFLPTVESPDVRQYAYRLMAQGYAVARQKGAAADAAVERRLLDPSFEASEVLAACNMLADADPKQPVVARCATDVKAVDAPAQALRERLTGTVQLARGDVRAAAASLGQAARAIDLFSDPALHLRLAQALTATGETREACVQAQRVYAAHALLEGAKAALGVCGDAHAMAQAIDAQLKEHLLKSRRPGDTPIPTLQLEGPKLEAVDLELAKSGKVTVLLFFATWCPHCQTEMPRIVDFASRVAKRPAWKDKVQVLAVRTAVERESEPYEAFAARYKMNFPVLTDSTMSMTFSRFAKAANLAAGLPTLAVLDSKGIVRFTLAPGDYKDTAQELEWVVGALLTP